MKTKKLFSIILSLAMMLSVLPIGVFAAESEGITYVERMWDDMNKQVVETEKECEDFIVVDGNTTSFEDGKWYVVNSNVTNNNKISVTGNANLILADGNTFTNTKGIEIKGDSELNVYGQSADSGKLTVKCDTLPIGDDEDPGKLTVHGGTVTATSNNIYEGDPGISASVFTIYGGTVNAKGSDEYYTGAGITGGLRKEPDRWSDSGWSYYLYEDGAIVNVYGGTVNATGGTYYDSDFGIYVGGAGIGGSRFGNGGTVTVWGGTVNANGGYGAAGIGGGHGGKGRSFIIYDGTVNANGGYGAAGIGGGKGSNGGSFTFNGGNVTAIGGTDAPGIGHGFGYSGPIADFTANVPATVKAAAAAPGEEMTVSQYSSARSTYVNIEYVIIVKGENWYIDSLGTLYITGPVTKESDNSDNTPWKEYKPQIKAVVAKEGAKINDCSRMFSNCTNLTSVDIKKLDTSGVTNMQYMFSGCSSLETLDLTGLDTSSLISTMCMFYNASALKSINFTGFNTAGVWDMQYMFRNCASLTELDLSSFDTSRVTTMSTMFYDCTSLETLDISNFNCNRLSNTDFIFGRCQSLKKVLTNDNALQKLAEPLIGAVNPWYNESDNTEYASADALIAIEGKVTLSAEKVSETPYVIRSWDGSSVVESNGICYNAAVVDSTTTTLEDGKWYVVDKNVTVNARMKVTGTANLILCDECTLTASKGITLTSGNTLNVYGQKNDTGALVSTATATTAVIGGTIRGTCGNINVCGGNVTATVTSSTGSGAGIGGGSNGAGGNVVIYGGSITATAVKGAGIGGGLNGDGGTFTYYGGSVTATGTNGAGIGRGSGTAANDGTFSIKAPATIMAGTAAPGTETTDEIYNSERLGYVNITEKTVPFLFDTISLAISGHNFTVTASGKDAGTGIVMVALYNNKDSEQLIDVRLFDLSKVKIDALQGTFTQSGYVKAFWWTDLETITPLCEPDYGKIE